MHKKTFHAIAVVIFLLLFSFFTLAGEPVDYQEQYRKKMLERGTQSLAKLRERNQKIITEIVNTVHRLAKEKRLEWEFKNFMFETREVIIDMGEVKLGPRVEKVPERHLRVVVKCQMKNPPKNKNIKRSNSTEDKQEVKDKESSIDTEGVSERQEAFWQRNLIPYNQLDNMDLFKSAVTAKFGQGRSYDERLAMSSRIDIHSKIEIQELVEHSSEIIEKFINCYTTEYELPLNLTGKEVTRIQEVIQDLGLQKVACLQYRNRNDAEWTTYVSKSKGKIKDPTWRLAFRFEPFPHQPFPHDAKNPFNGKNLLVQTRKVFDEVIQVAETSDVVQLEEVFTKTGVGASIQGDISLFHSSPLVKAERLIIIPR